MNITEEIRKIKQELRLSMNGVASAFMREGGLNYKLNFGVEIPRLQSIAKDFQPNHDLAQTLWKENIRECKILAGMLQPVNSFYPEIAEIWIENMPNAEIAQLTVINLFQKLPYASEKAFQWIAREEEMFQLCGYLLLARLFMQGKQLNERSENEFIDQAAASIQHADGTLKKAIINALIKYEEINEQRSPDIEKLIQL